MKIIVFFVFVLMGLLMVFSTSVPLQSAIPASERAALIALYSATNGDNWTYNTGWKGNNNESDGFSKIGSEGNWCGITVSGDHVTEIWLIDYSLNGSIPKELGNLSNLEVLLLSLNQLSGSIPAEMGNLCKLGTLQLDHNQLSGSIPAEIGNLSNLRIITLESNQLSGSIPAEIGNLSNLEWLYLGSNQLSGSIPPEIGHLSNLKGFILTDNRLSGSIPAEIGNLSNLYWFYLSSNQLTGNIPSSLTNLTYLFSSESDIGYNGLYTNDNTLRTFLNFIDPDWEGTQTIAPANVSAAGISTSSIRVSWTPISYTGNTGGYKVYYSITPGGAWTYAGMTTDKSASSYDVTGLSLGTKYYFVVKTQTNSHSNNDNTIVSEYSEEVSTTPTSPLEEKDPPFGSFDTPIDGSTVASSIPVTGWALDDTGIDSVKIYRAQGKSLVYIGDAVLVEGARPDVAAAYPGYPNNTRAGWGYMMLTNFLPNGGNGTFVIVTIATDVVGKTTTLGSKTIHCDNANAVKPFGAIDTPTQGGTASGISFINWGWVLTPQPNSIPTDGSTINVYVDGVNIGHPTYNKYRSDIATLFPGYNNSDGAAGYFYLDTTAYENGVHTIQWTATDDAGNTDGIGSRYFTIQNTGGAAESRAHLDHINLTQIPVDYYGSIEIIVGCKQDTTPQEIYPDDSGMINVEIRELERIEILLAGTRGLAPLSDYAGCLAAGNQLKQLPIGSFLDSGKGIFYWQPGVGFIGEYRFVFIGKGQDGEFKKKSINLVIRPKF